MVIGGNRTENFEEHVYLALNDVATASMDFAEKKYLCESKALKNLASQRAGYVLIEKFDEFCKNEHIEYFLFAKTLQGAVAYQGFIPDSATIEIAMIRPEYLRFEKAFIEYQNVKKELPFLLSAFHNQKKTIRRLRPEISLRASFQVFLDNGEPVYTNKSIPLYAKNSILISIFDEVSDDKDFEKYHAQRMKLANLLARKITKLKDPSQNAGKKNFTKVLAKVLPWRIANNHAWKLAGKYNGKDTANYRRVAYSFSKRIPRDQLYPLKRLKFGSTELLCPQDTSTWVNEDLELLKKSIKILQKDTLKIMLEIDRICRENNIGYFICGGTLLGYMRHGGFIPWDDDIDIGMLRADYNRFMSLASKHLGSDFFLQTRESDPLIPYLFSKVRLNNSEYVTSYNEERDFHKGICVDIFPFDKVPNNEAELLEHRSKVVAKAKSHNKVANNQLPPPSKKEPIRNLSGIIARLMGMRQRRKYRRKSLIETQRQYDKIVTSLNGVESYTYVASFIPTFTMTRLEDLIPYQDVPFEEVVLRAPANPEIFLRMQYGDFEALPPLHQQRGHELLWWNDKEVDSRDLYSQKMKSPETTGEKYEHNEKEQLLGQP